MLEDYQNKVCVVTGAASGIGKALCEKLVALGAQVYALDRNKADIEGLSAFVETDLSDKGSIDAAFCVLPQVIDRFFGVAGLSGARTSYWLTFTVNFIANKYMTDTYLEKRIPSGGSIAYVTSCGGLMWEKWRKEYVKVMDCKTWDEMVAFMKSVSPKDGVGVLGAAVATDVSQAISGVISLIYLIKKFKILHMTRDEWKYSRSTCRRLSAMGLPMGLQCTITAVGGVIMQWAVNGLGSSVVAAITAAGKTQNLLSCALESIGTAMATYAGQNLGAARLDRVRSGVKSSYIMVVAYSVLAFIALHFGDVVIIGLFLDTKTEVEIVAMARDYMFWNSLFFIPLGALIVWRYTIQGLGYSTLAMMAGVAEMVARTVIGLVLIPVLGYFGAELSNPVAWVAACLFLYPAYLWTVKHLENRLLAGHLAMQHSAVGD